MSENRNRSERDFSKYDEMETEDLEQILRSDADAPEGVEPDVELILYVMEVLANRRRNNNQASGKTALEAFESFKQNYLPEEVSMETAPDANQPKGRPMRWLRGLTAAAAVLAFVFLGSVTANAFGINIWKAVAVWAQETFHLQGDVMVDTEVQGTERDIGYASLEEAIYDVERVYNVAPTWIPDGYELFELIVDENPLQKIYVAVYSNGEARLKIAVQSYQNGYPEQIEHSDGTEETIEVSGIIYHIFEDNDQLRAVWIKDSYECYITGELTVEQIETMIHSIEKG